MTILDQLNTIFRSAFDDESLVIKRETTAADIEGWDSFMHVNLIVAIEEHFNVAFSTAEIGSFTCVGDVADLLGKKGVPESAG